ncbi:acyclic terpene utilization AtuA family protein [Rhizobium sp. YS-1r]|uniref:acyclic terpene utilization AtuA family protein n=1 Tax=Rhizobium sp. YS-1r TaxID=1532558 RepID=UPI001FCA5EBC|nr:acyclic terpene utilization AtuA family protein [Rhizobium sp. YS-1r]
MYRIGSGAGFSGDRIDAAQPVVEAIAATGEGGAIIFETIGERTLALGQIAKRRDPKAGYEPLLEQFLPPILKTCVENRIVIVGNFGCANPRAAADTIRAMAEAQGFAGARIAVVEGDDLVGRVDISATERWEGDRHLPAPSGDVIAVNAYIGARPIAEAIRAGAQVVVTGRVADPALALGPLVAHFGWDWNDLDLLAAGTLAGHLLECGSQVSGGFFADPGYKDVPDPANIGFPIAEVEADGTFVLTKAEGTGGCVDTRTVKEQLLYEIHDPAAYLTPDVTLDLTEVEVVAVGRDRVRVTGARGHAAPTTLKATVGYYGDWLGEAEISYAGPERSSTRAACCFDHARPAGKAGARCGIAGRRDRYDQRFR